MTNDTPHLSDKQLLALVPSNTATPAERWESWRVLGDRVSATKSSSSFRCYRAGCGLEGPHVKFWTLGRGSVCGWCRSHGSGGRDLTPLLVSTFYADPAGGLEYVFSRHGGRAGVRTLLRFLRRHDAI